MFGNTCCGIGNPEMSGETLMFVKEKLEREIRQAIEDGYTHFISGFAEGVDLLFASIVVDLKKEDPALTLEAAIPYRDRLETDDGQFHKLLGQCSCVGIISEEHSPTCYMSRNRYMIKNSRRVIMVYDGQEKEDALLNIRYASTLGRDVRLIEIQT